MNTPAILAFWTPDFIMGLVIVLMVLGLVAVIILDRSSRTWRKDLDDWRTAWLERVRRFPIKAILWSALALPVLLFIAYLIYESPEGLKSRLERREDFHYPTIPEADWHAGVDPDKQCSVTANVTKYPQRCAGPALINPLVSQAFLDGAGEGAPIDDDPAIAAARIEAGGLWFLYLSVYKEVAEDDEKNCN